MKLYYIDEKDFIFIFFDEIEFCLRIIVILVVVVFFVGFFVYFKLIVFLFVFGVNIIVVNLDEDIKYSKLYDL